MSVSEVEELRKKAKNIILGWLIAGLVIGIIAFAISGSFFVGIIALIVCLMVCGIAGVPAKKRFVEAFKKEFVLKSLESIFEDVVYTPEQGLGESEIRSTEMMQMGNEYSSNDLIIAKYKNIKFTQADVLIQQRTEKRDSNGNKIEEVDTIFKGRWMIFDFNKQFKANLQVRQKGFANAKINNWFTTTKYKKVELEDEMFNKTFKTYAQSEHEAFYILTPSLMERIKNLVGSIKGHVLLCFINNKLHVGVANNVDSFEHSVFTPIDEQQVINSISKDIKLITSFVDELNLDNDLFRKGV